MTPELLLMYLYQSEDINCIKVKNNFRAKESISFGPEINSSTYIIPNRIAFGKVILRQVGFHVAQEMLLGGGFFL